MTVTDQLDGVLTIKEAANAAKVSERTLREHIHAGNLRTRLWGRCRRVMVSDLNDFMAADHQLPKRECVVTTARGIYLAQCNHKIAYRSKAKAAKAQRQVHFTVAPYLCQWCGAWHLGHDRRRDAA